MKITIKFGDTALSVTGQVKAQLGEGYQKYTYKADDAYYSAKMLRREGYIQQAELVRIQNTIRERLGSTLSRVRGEEITIE